MTVKKLELPVPHSLDELRHTLSKLHEGILPTDPDRHTPRLHSGSYLLDRAIGGGFPYGSIAEIWGPEAAGKSTLMLECAAAALAQGEAVVYIDAEQRLDVPYAQRIGIDFDDPHFLLVQPFTAEQALDVLDRVAEASAARLIVIDSIAALSPRAEYEGEIGEQHIGLLPRVLAQGLRKSVAHIKRSGTVVLCVNQVREKIGVLYGSNETTPGGRALKHFATVKVRIGRAASKDEKEGDQVVAIHAPAHITKSSAGGAYRSFDLSIRLGEGVDHVTEVYLLALQDGLLQVTGGTHRHQDQVIGRSKAETIQALRHTPRLFDALAAAVQQRSGAGDAVTGEPLEPAVPVS